ncbi:MAG: hypothetical protein WCA00_19845 [Candidatus Acidiferrales bacterium]
MTALIIYLLIGAALFIFLLALARRKGAPVEGCGQEFVEARHALLTLRSGLLPSNLIERIFGRGDLEYVTAETPPEIRRMFLGERKRISLMWASRVRLEIRNLMHFHLGYSRFEAKMSLPTELRLALDFVVLLLACRTLQLLLFSRGPYGAPAIVGVAAAAAARVCSTSEKSLAFLNPLTGDSLPKATAGGGAAI